MTERPISRSIRRLFASSGAVGLALLALPGQAQEAAPAPKPVARVEITGSNIRRSQAETSSSVITVNRADIERSGKASVAELLQTLAVDNSGSVPASFGAGFAAGASGISLRGLGAASTLVLLNGRRMAPYGLADDGQKQFSDLNIIPSDAVERIEVLKDGASAIYGSDAIAGVVNVILRKDFTGTTLRAMRGITRYWDGHETTAAITSGYGNLDNDRYNVLFSLEYKKFNPIWYRDRGDRKWIGKDDLRPWGYSSQQGLGGTGAIIPDSGTASSAINGNVRPAGTTDYVNRGSLIPAANCARLTNNYPQGDPGGGCLLDTDRFYGQALPKAGKPQLLHARHLPGHAGHPGLQRIQLVHQPDQHLGRALGGQRLGRLSGGPVNNAIVQLGPFHPDNPFQGTPARLRYLAADVGPVTAVIDGQFIRAVGGVKGTNFGWDWDSALLFSHNHLNTINGGFLQRDATFALLDPSPANVAIATANNPAYAALPPGTVWRIGENTGLNSPALYAALSPTIGNEANTKMIQWDLKATREFAGLPVLTGPLGLAVGTEWRHEYTQLQPVAGTERGNIIGLGYSAYSGQRNVFAMYAEALAPLPYNVEASAAVRWDHFTDVGNSYTPKAGLKWTPVRSFALRGTFARGFRAPSFAENGRGGLAAFANADDPVRCALGIASACNLAGVAVITTPNPALSPERSRSYTLGVIWDPLPRTSISVDYWKIKRKNEINQEQLATAIATGSVARDPTGASGIPGDPGPITAVLTRYVNSAQTKVRGLDIDARYAHKLPDNYGLATFDVKYTHFFEWLRTEQDGTSREFAGTHGNCDVTNCAGTPDNRANFRFGWERNDWRVSLNANYRGKIDNVLFRGDTCAVTFDDGRNAPNSRCELASFISWDLTAHWKPLPQWEVFGSIQNLFDKDAPLDPTTYGATSYNPLDFEGARGRLFTLGARYTF